MRHRVLLGLYRLTRYYAWWVLLVALALAILALFSLRDLKLRSSFRELLPRDDPILEKFEKYEEIFQETQAITILISLKSPPPSPGERVARLLSAAQQIQQALQQNEEIDTVSYRQERRDLPSLPINLRNVSEESVRQLTEMVSHWKATVGEPTPLGNVPQPLDVAYASFTSALEQLISGLAVLNPQALAEALQQLDQRMEDLRRLNEQVSAILGRLPEELQQTQQRIDEISQLIGSWQSALLPAPPRAETEYLLSREGQALLIQVWPRQSAQISLDYNRRITQIVRETLNSLRLSSQGLEWGLKGPYVFTMETDEALRRDMERTALITHVGVLLLFVFVLRRLFYPLLATLPILMAVIFAIVSAQLLFGGLNQLTAFLPAIVLGMGIDYGIQFISHYIEERSQSRRIAPALRATLLTKGSAMLIAALATSLVLFGLGIVARSTGLSEMGFIVGLGVLFSCLLTLIVLPALIIAVHTVLGKRFRRRPPRPWDWSPATRGLIRARGAVVGLVLVGTIAIAWPASRIEFTFITEAFMPTNLPSQQVRTYIEQHFEREEVPDLENYFLFVTKPSEEGVRQLCNELDRLEAIDQPPIAYFCLFPEPSELDQIKQRLVTLKELDPTQPLTQGALRLSFLQVQFNRREALEHELNRLEEELQEGQEDIFRLEEELAEELRQLQGSTHAIRERLTQLRPLRPEDQLQVLQVKLNALIEQVRGILSAIPKPEEIDRLINNPPPELQRKFFTPDGQAIVYAHVRSEWLWNSARYDQFIHGAREVCRDICADFLGQPMLRAALEDFMQRDFWWSTGLAVMIILVVLGLDFIRSSVRGATGLSLVTLGLGYLWMLGVMDLLGIDFNVANILISPLLIGLGVDNCVYLLHRHRDFGGRSIERATASTALPIAANALATMIGFGSLMLAETSALRILGQTAVMGIGFMTLFSLTFLPAVIALRQR